MTTPTDRRLGALEAKVGPPVSPLDAEVRRADEWLHATIGRGLADLTAWELARMERLCREWPDDGDIPAAALRACLDSDSAGEVLPSLPPELRPR
jgi:hypothetical protein